MDPNELALLYARIVESTSEGVWVIDAESVTIYANASMAELLGYAREELVGKSLFDFMDEEGRRIAARNVARRRGGISEAHEFVFRRKDGTELWTRLTTDTLRAEDGTYQGALALVTKLGLPREHDQERARLWRTFDESLNELYFFRERDLCFEYVNRGALQNLGYTLDEMRAKTPVDIKPEHTHDSFRTLVAPLVDGREEKLRFETVHARKDGSTYPVEVHLQLVSRDGDGHFLAIINDISERRAAERSLRKLEEQLQQSQRLESIGRLAGGIAHDFNNILTTILSSVGFLEDGSLGDAQRADLREIGKAAERAAELTNQLLAFARRRLIRPKSIDLGRAIKAQERFLGRVLGEEVTLVTHIADGLWPVLADATQFEQVILNLAVNARDAMPGGGRLTLAAENVMIDDSFASLHGEITAGPYVLVTVSDTGEGIPKETLPHVFEPFFTTKPVGAGTGLGLATVYGIVRQSGGHIEVHSKPDLETTFKMYFPRTTEHDEGDAAVREPEVERGHERILVVEDDETVRRMIVRALESGGYVVHAEPDPDAGLAWARERRGWINLLVTDVVMPGMSGKELATRLFAEQPEVRVLYVSGYTQDTIVHRGVLEPGVELLSKPFSPKQLCARVRGLLDRK